MCIRQGKNLNYAKEKMSEDKRSFRGKYEAHQSIQLCSACYCDAQQPSSCNERILQERVAFDCAHSSSVLLSSESESNDGHNLSQLEHTLFMVDRIRVSFSYVTDTTSKTKSIEFWVAGM